MSPVSELIAADIEGYLKSREHQGLLRVMTCGSVDDGKSTLTDEIDISRGDLISAAQAPAQVAAQFDATVVWMSEQPMLRGRSYLMKIGAKTVTATSPA